MRGAAGSTFVLVDVVMRAPHHSQQKRIIISCLWVRQSASGVREARFWARTGQPELRRVNSDSASRVSVQMLSTPERAEGAAAPPDGGRVCLRRERHTHDRSPRKRNAGARASSCTERRWELSVPRLGSWSRRRSRSGDPVLSRRSASRPERQVYRRVPLDRFLLVRLAGSSLTLSVAARPRWTRPCGIPDLITMPWRNIAGGRPSHELDAVAVRESSTPDGCSTEWGRTANSHRKYACVEYR
ncbi:Hypothetical protein I5071_52630 [Sandaracinus amylolyticus]|nr:Hypothetical protein I5071_52630 [Sandaracinus amylolyticus]